MMVNLIVAGYTSINAIVKAMLFPTEIRTLGIGFPYVITVAVFSGTTELIALLKSIGHESPFYFYAAVCIAISFITYWRMGKSSHIEAELADKSTQSAHKSSF